jgi:TonB family protein
MKKTIATIFFLVFLLSSMAQSISVKSFRALPNDMDARQNYPEKDLNGDLCAIIKIATLEKGFSFDIGSLGITKTEQKDGEIWIWIPRGAKRITITHKAFLPLRDYFFTESIQEGVCYELILVSGKVVTTVVEEEIPTQWLLINTNPPGADVYINDQAAGKTPYQNELAVGKYTWRVQKELYLNDAGVVELIAGTQKQKIDIKLKANYGTLNISTDPEVNAEVFMNGMSTNKTTPCQIEKVPSGEKSIKATKNLYQISDQVITVSPESNLQVVLISKPTFGTVSVNSTPESGAAVSFDGISTGKTTPCTIEKVPAGEHSITVSYEMYETTNQRFTLVAGETKPLGINMNPTFAGITLSTEPTADIYINGEFKANAKWQGRLNPGIYTFEAKLDKHQSAIEKQTVTIGQPLNLTLRPTPKTGNLKIMSTPFEATIKIDGKELGQTPITLKNMLIGDYTIELSLAGYATAIEKATISEGQTASINATLVNGRAATVNSNPTGVNLFIDNVSVGNTPWQGNLTFGSHSLRIEQADKKAEKEISLAQTGGETTFSLGFGPQNLTETVNGVSFDMIAVKGSIFMMGSPTNVAYRNDNETQHQVTVSDYFIGKYEITQKQWIAIMGNNPSYKKGDNLPVEQVSWDDVQEFIQKLNKKTGKKYRLPTEAEWEYAARGGASVASISSTGSEATATLYSGSNYFDEVAWYGRNSGNKTHPVGQKKANALGIYDMSGNVWEWCSDWYGNYGSGSQSNPQGPLSGTDRVYRGGSWYNDPEHCRVSNRKFSSPDRKNDGLGFRLVYAPSDSFTENISKLKEEVFEGNVFTIVETMPEFPGGEDGKLQYFARNLIYPTIARSNGIQGKVFLNFIVEPNGSVSNVTVLRDIGGGCAEEAIRLVKAMPKWTPGKQKGKAVRVTVNTSVSFAL